jgi:hypothetical protein
VAPIADRTSRRERLRHAPAVCGTGGACHPGGVSEHRSNPLTADPFSARAAPADTIPTCAYSLTSLPARPVDRFGETSKAQRDLRPFFASYVISLLLARLEVVVAENVVVALGAERGDVGGFVDAASLTLVFEQLLTA